MYPCPGLSPALATQSFNLRHSWILGSVEGNVPKRQKPWQELDKSLCSLIPKYPHAYILLTQ